MSAWVASSGWQRYEYAPPTRIHTYSSSDTPPGGGEDDVPIATGPAPAPGSPISFTPPRVDLDALPLISESDLLRDARPWRYQPDSPGPMLVGFAGEVVTPDQVNGDIGTLSKEEAAQLETFLNDPLNRALIEQYGGGARVDDVSSDVAQHLKQTYGKYFADMLRLHHALAVVRKTYHDALDAAAQPVYDEFGEARYRDLNAFNQTYFSDPNNLLAAAYLAYYGVPQAEYMTRWMGGEMRIMVGGADEAADNFVFGRDINDHPGLYDDRLVFFDPRVGFVTPYANIKERNDRFLQFVEFAAITIATWGASQAVELLLAETLTSATGSQTIAQVLSRSLGASLVNGVVNGEFSIKDFARAVTSQLLNHYASRFLQLDQLGVDSATGQLDWSTRALNWLARGTVNGSITRLLGGRFEDGFRAGVAQAFGADAARWIGDNPALFEPGTLTFTLAHATVGLTQAGILGRDRAAGALGAFMSAALIEQMLDAHLLTPDQARLAAQLLGGLTAVALRRDPWMAGNAALNQIENNGIRHYWDRLVAQLGALGKQAMDRLAQLLQQGSTEARGVAKQIVESALKSNVTDPNLINFLATLYTIDPSLFPRDLMNSAVGLRVSELAGLMRVGADTLKGVVDLAKLSAAGWLNIVNLLAGTNLFAWAAETSEQASAKLREAAQYLMEHYQDLPAETRKLIADTLAAIDELQKKDPAAARELQVYLMGAVATMIMPTAAKGQLITVSGRIAELNALIRTGKYSPDDVLRMTEEIKEIQRWNFYVNKINGNGFEAAAMQVLQLDKYRSKIVITFADGRTMSIAPDVISSHRVIEFKDWIDLRYTDQLKAMVKYAMDSGIPLDLIVSPRTQSINEILRQDVLFTGGNIYVLDPATGIKTLWKPPGKS